MKMSDAVGSKIIAKSRDGREASSSSSSNDRPGMSDALRSERASIEYRLQVELENYVERMRRVEVDLQDDPSNMKLVSLKTMLNNKINLTNKVLLMINTDGPESEFLLNVPAMHQVNSKKVHMVVNELEVDPTSEELLDLKEELREVHRLLGISARFLLNAMIKRLIDSPKPADHLGAVSASGPSRSSIASSTSILGGYNLKWNLSNETTITTLTAEVKIPSGNVDKPRIEKNRWDGTISIKYEPREKGLHELYVKENGEPIIGSPCKFHVGVVAGAFIHAYGDGLEHGVSGERCNFNIKIKAVDPGCLHLTVEGPAIADILCEENEGAVSVSYWPTVPGWYKISAKFCDETINGSPFSAKITGTLKPTYALGQATFYSSGAGAELYKPSRSSIKVATSSSTAAESLSFWEYVYRAVDAALRMLGY